MSDEVMLVVGGSLADDLAAFRSAWDRAERGEATAPERVLAFESWEGLSSVLTGERYRLLRHLRRVQTDVQALEQAGLVDRCEPRRIASSQRSRCSLSGALS